MAEGSASRGRHPRLLSVVAPMLNEEAVVHELHRRLSAMAEAEHLDAEFIFVDDGSTDGTAQILNELAAADPRVRVIHLSRRFGHQVALTAGLDHARGEAVVMIDADLQDPPEVIPELIAKWRDGADVVVARRRSRPGETRFKLTTARWFYALMSRIAQVEIEVDAGDFRLLDRQPLDALLRLRERDRFLRGMTSWVGFEQAVVLYDRAPRSAGTTKYPLGALIRFAVDAVSSFSRLPLQLATLCGVFFAFVALLAVPLTVVARYAGIYDRGVPSILFTVLLIGGIQLITLGVIGEYLGRIYDEVKRRPLYVVRERRNVEGPQEVVERVDREVSVP